MKLRPFQKKAISYLNSNQNLICISPTGSGKSLIYEKVAQFSNTKTLIISPLTALARQQRTSLISTGLISYPDTKSNFWVMCPELILFLKQKNDLLELKKFNPTFLVVDECHCLYEWGECFRPSFNLILPLLKLLNIKKSLWLTATLPVEMQKKLISSLPSPNKIMGSFGLPKNIFIRVLNLPIPDRISFLIELTQTNKDPGIIFTFSKALAVRLSRVLVSQNIKSMYYHSGLSHEEKKNIESKLKTNQVEVIVSTSAFGMGMNFPQLRWVVLFQPSPTLLSLTQAIGRVGRSGLPASAYLLWENSDFFSLKSYFNQNKNALDSLKRVHIFFSKSQCRIKNITHEFIENEPSKNHYGCNQCDYCLNQYSAISR